MPRLKKKSSVDSVEAYACICMLASCSCSCSCVCACTTYQPSADDLNSGYDTGTANRRSPILQTNYSAENMQYS